MPATRKPRTRRTHARSIRVLIPARPGQPDTYIRITQDAEAAHYWVTGLVTDFGLGFRLEKPGFEGTEVYDVLLEHDGASCTCAGGTYGGYCKHADACRALLTAGLLPPLAHEPHEADVTF